MYVFELVGEKSDDGFATYEAAALARDVRLVAPGVAVADELSPHVSRLGWTRSISELIERVPNDVDAMEQALQSADLPGGARVAVRARGVRETEIDTLAVERRLGAILDAHGYTIDLSDPDQVLRVLVSDGEGYLGWVREEPGGDVGRRRPTDRPFFQPGSMAPRLARGLVNIAGARPGARILDPMCGTGGILLEALRVGAGGVGFDAQARMVSGTARNCAAVDLGPPHLARADAGRLPVRDGGVDAVVFDAPYGRQSHIAGDGLLARALDEARRVADQAVVVTDRPAEQAAAAAGWTIVRTFERRVHRSLTRHITHIAAGEKV